MAGEGGPREIIIRSTRNNFEKCKRTQWQMFCCEMWMIPDLILPGWRVGWTLDCPFITATAYKGWRQGCGPVSQYCGTQQINILVVRYFKLDFLSDKAKADDGSNLKLQTGSTLKCKSVQKWMSAQIHFTFTITSCDVNGTWIKVFKMF